MALYLRTLPPEARLSRHPGDEFEWTVQTELLAQLVEVTSVSTAGRQLRKPIEIKRPSSLTRTQNTAVGFRAALAAAQAEGRVKVG